MPKAAMVLLVVLSGCRGGVSEHELCWTRTAAEVVQARHEQLACVLDEGGPYLVTCDRPSWRSESCERGYTLRVYSEQDGNCRTCVHEWTW